MTAPMTLKRSLEVAIECLPNLQFVDGDALDAATTLRAALPFIKAAEAHFEAVALMKRGWSGSLAVENEVIRTGTAALAAYRTLRESTK